MSPYFISEIHFKDDEITVIILDSNTDIKREIKMDATDFVHYDDYKFANQFANREDLK